VQRRCLDRVIFGPTPQATGGERICIGMAAPMLDLRLRARDENGQTIVLAAVGMLVFVAMVAVVDVGGWMQQQRSSQSTVDAAALAGAAALPVDPTAAVDDARDYASKNFGTAGADFTVGTKFVPNDMITVTQTTDGQGLFSKVIGVDKVQIHTHASAIAEPPASLIGVAPITVKITHPQLSGPGCPCFDVPTTIGLGDQGAPGAFSLLDLDSAANGTDGASTVAQWISTGFDRQLPLGGYFSRPGAAFNNSQIQGALTDKIGSELLFPIYDTLTGQGSGAVYHIVAWAAFHITGTAATGQSGTLTGWFTRIVWTGVVSSGPPPPQPDFGVRSVALVQ
jgi:Putative Flp pilus-assembly TadE/G-like